MSIELKRLREERAEIQKQAQAILRRATEEGRDLRSEEQDKVDGLMAKSDEVRQQAAKLEAEEKERSQRLLDRLEGRRTLGNVLTRSDSFRDYLNHEYGKATSEYRNLGELIANALHQGKSEIRLTTTSGATGLQDTEMLGGFIDLFRANSVAMKAGVRMRPLSGEHTSWKQPKLTADVTASWRDENGTVTRSTANVAAVTWTPKNIGALVRVSREAFQDLMGLDELLRVSFAGAFATAVDQALLGLTTDSSAPAGILASTGSFQSTINARLLDPVVESAIRRLMDNNVPTSDVSLVCCPRDYEFFQTQLGTDGQPLGRSRMLNEANLKAFQTSSISVSTAGTASAIVGNFADGVFGIREELNLTILNERYADTGEIGIVGHLRGDFQILRPTSFERLASLTTAATT